MAIKFEELKQLVAMKKWQEWINLLLGLWMLIAPGVLDFMHDRSATAMWTAWTWGVATLVFTETANYLRQSWKEGIHVLLGVVLMISPWLLGYAAQSRPTNNAVTVGIVTVVLAIWTMALEMDLRRWLREHHLIR